MIERTPLVSVIIPNYNYERSLRLCLQALAEQAYPRLEVIVVDDGSTDDSVAVAQSFGAKVVHTPVNMGCAGARNVGAEAATGEVFFFLDSDVGLAPDAVANAVTLLRSDERIGAVCGIYDADPLIDDGPVERYRSLQLHYVQVACEGPISGIYPAMMAMRAEVFAAVGPFNAKLRHTEDADYGARLGRAYELRLTSAVRGRHDHDDKLKVLLNKVFTRSLLRVPLFAGGQKLGKGPESPARAAGSLAALGAVLTVPLPLLAGPLWTVVPAGLLLGSIAADGAMYRFVARRRGVGFGLFFVGTNLVSNVAIAAGVLTGAAQWVLSPRFRRIYDEVPA
ncbi:glycosyltransferase family 2 protein [Amycolatopsis sp. lyj-346]|uniref:glycosyltransferase family 2 protein n=1 Tax=Amycolatopsis sp. lyj-346 TaxID=2789289 RepID=UPI00397D555E